MHFQVFLSCMCAGETLTVIEQPVKKVSKFKYSSEGELNKNSWLIYCSGHLTIEQDELVSQQRPILSSYVMSKNASLMTNLDSGL